MIIKEWEFPLLREMVINNAEMTTKQAHEFLRDQGIKISRASVIQSMKRMHEDYILDFTEASGQGGIRRVYSRAVNGKEFMLLVRQAVEEVYELASQSLKGSAK